MLLAGVFGGAERPVKRLRREELTESLGFGPFEGMERVELVSVFLRLNLENCLRCVEVLVKFIEVRGQGQRLTIFLLKPAIVVDR